jgi:hypothetical protein
MLMSAHKSKKYVGAIALFGHRRWIWATIRATTSTAAGEVSMLDRRSLAAADGGHR